MSPFRARGRLFDFGTKGEGRGVWGAEEEAAAEAAEDVVVGAARLAEADGIAAGTAAAAGVGPKSSFHEAGTSKEILAVAPAGFWAKKDAPGPTFFGVSPQRAQQPVRAASRVSQSPARS